MLTVVSYIGLLVLVLLTSLAVYLTLVKVELI